MVQSTSWEANWFAASQEIPRILWNPKVHYRTHKRPRNCMWMFLNINVLQGEFVSPSPNPQAGGPPLVGCPRLLIQFIRSYPPYWRPFLYPQPEDAPCRGDRDPLHRLGTRTALSCWTATRNCLCTRHLVAVVTVTILASGVFVVSHCRSHRRVVWFRWRDISETERPSRNHQHSGMTGPSQAKPKC